MYKGARPVLWSVVEKTALADAEVEYKDHTSNTIYVKFQVTKSKIKELINNNILIWTTTPWTIPGNRALAYSADLEYIIIQIIETNNSSIAKITISQEEKILSKLITNEGTEIHLQENHPAHNSLSQCDLALTTVGANTAELGALGVPMIVIVPTQHLSVSNVLTFDERI